MFDPQSPFTRKTLGPASLQDFAHARVREAILTCELAPGERVSEAGLVSRFGVAKAAVRVALARLEAAGLVTAVARRGWRVAPITGSGIRALVAARRTIEPTLADITLPQAASRELGALAQTAAAAHGAPGISTARAAHRGVFDRLARYACNPIIERWLGALWDETGRILALSPQALAADCRPLISALADARHDDARAEILAGIDAFERLAVDLAVDWSANIGATPQTAPKGSAPRTQTTNGDHAT